MPLPRLPLEMETNFVTKRSRKKKVSEMNLGQNEFEGRMETGGIVDEDRFYDAYLAGVLFKKETEERSS